MNLENSVAHIEVLLFAGLKAQFQSSRLIISTITPIAVNELIELIISLRPDLSDQISASLVACNGQIAETSKMITEKDEVALLPPMSGG